jgi:hypothetical protein
MAPWLIASALGIAVPMLLEKNKQAQQNGQNGQAPVGQVGGAPQAHWPGGMAQYPDPKTYPIPLDTSIDPRSAASVYNAWQTATVQQLVAFSNEIRAGFPIAAAVLYAKALVLSEIAASNQARVRQEEAYRVQQEAARAALREQKAQVEAAAQAAVRAERPMVPAVQEVRVIPTVPIAGSEAAQTPAPAANGAAVVTAPPAREAVLVPAAQGGVG